MIEYIDEDLDFIFIRAKNNKGKWDNLSVRELNKKQWEDYLIKKFGDGKKFWTVDESISENEEWTDEDKLGIINWLARNGVIFTMIARDKRKSFKNSS